MNTRQPTNWQLIAQYLEPQRVQVAILIALVIAMVLLQLIIPQIIRAFLDGIQAHASSTTLSYLAVYFLILAVLSQTIAVAATYVSNTIGWHATNALRSDLALHSLQLDISFYKTHTPGMMIERIDGDVTAIANFFSKFFMNIFSNAILIIGILIFLFWENWFIGFLISMFVLLALLVLNGILYRVTPRWQQARRVSADLFGFLEEILGRTEDIRSLGATHYIMQLLYKLMKKRLVTERYAHLAGTILWLATAGVLILGTGIGLTFATYFFKLGTLGIGTVYVILHYIEMLHYPIWQIGQEIGDFQTATASIMRIEELYSMPSRLQESALETVAAPLLTGPIAVVFDDVYFSYQEESPVLDAISFSLPAGKTLGLVGRTGSGKSTLVRLLVRLYDPQWGVIYLNGHDSTQVPLKEIREKIGMVTQDVQLFHATVRDNLTFFDATISDETIINVINALGLQRWYKKFKQGLDTRLAPSGHGLSAGEAQLLAFIRIFLKNPGLVILDEASSRLDRLTEQLLQRATNTLLHQRTGIIIAHRLATIMHVDLILMLDKGAIVEYGERKELMKNPQSAFARLLKSGIGEVLE